MITAEQFWFTILSLLAIVSGLGMVTNKNPMRSGLFLVANFITLAAFYFMLQAQLLGIVQVIVYVGAILVLFLFVIMLLNLGAPELLKERGEIKLPIAILLGMAFMVYIGLQVAAVTHNSRQLAPPNIGTAETLGVALFTQWLFPFEITSILLLVGIVGSVLLAKRKLV